MAMVEKLPDAVSKTPTLFWLWGAKKTLLPTATAPLYFVLPPNAASPVVAMVENSLEVELKTPTLFWFEGEK
jgi:hypothetical protein